MNAIVQTVYFSGEQCVNLAVNVTFLTSQRNDYTLRENEDGFCEVHHKV